MTESSRHDFFEDRAGQLRSRASSMLEKMATWHIHSVAPFVTLVRARLRRVAERKPYLQCFQPELKHKPTHTRE